MAVLTSSPYQLEIVQEAPRRLPALMAGALCAPGKPNYRHVRQRSKALAVKDNNEYTLVNSQPAIRPIRFRRSRRQSVLRRWARFVVAAKQAHREVISVARLALSVFLAPTGGAVEPVVGRSEAGGLNLGVITRTTQVIWIVVGHFLAGAPLRCEHDPVDVLGATRPPGLSALWAGRGFRHEPLLVACSADDRPVNLSTVTIAVHRIRPPVLRPGLGLGSRTRRRRR